MPAGSQKQHQQKPQLSVLLPVSLLLLHLTTNFHPSNALSSPSFIPKKHSNNIMPLLTRLSPSQVKLEIKDPVDPTALTQAKSILRDITSAPSSRDIDPSKLISLSQKFGDIPAESTSYIVTKEECKAAFDGLTDEERRTLVNIHARVKAFAEMQRNSVNECEISIPGGVAGQTVSPCSAAGCYAPGGRYPLPSSVIMTAVTARTAGCPTVTLASPHPAPITLAAAHVSSVDLFLRIGGAQSIYAMAYGLPATDANPAVPPCDVIVGPGNKWVTAAKSVVSGYCGIDMLAGPSEVLVICDEGAEGEVVAADLIAQAEHDVVARAILLGTSEEVVERVDEALGRQLESLPEPNRSTAREALTQSFAVVCESVEECVKISDDIAPEHLEIMTKDSETVAKSCLNYGGLFIGRGAAEVLGDYGAGPNHTLPTGGTGRYTGGLSVFNFLRIRTWMRVDNESQSQEMVEDSIRMARLEGLEGHARAAEKRKI
mmetsp:Transcript_41618/g.50634  ORF Transcript_41618/g.50634 Transcript_41618/m.50634 type:complete len:487 (+) Transcript_41618:35-1495(+)|eukprot:CAMPEP_0172512964 /NCGR_PEP_ID=MMETSP1066-20121228/248438_1 /TAXON_ID=671091 /ORGANISM="Coscinodiscus wailesii, Strain CCMP2513" /LENGTH=486 /DNA_ID=CAMNT_0013292999 /DNA_START=13 /DNA_END=1473 /DNA_ORIENTATION=+